MGDGVQLSNIKIIGLGALNTDHIYNVERILGEGEAVVSSAASFRGGSAANTLYGLAKLGIKTGFAGVVGGDAEGKVLLSDFQKVGVDTSQISIKQGAKTGSVVCLSDSAGRRALYVMPGANNMLAIDDLDLDYINRAEMLHLSSFVNDSQFQVMLEVIKKLDPSIKVSFSPGALYAARGLRALAPILAGTYVLFINHSEMRKLTDKDFTAGAAICLEQGCQIVVVTLGKGASYKNVLATAYIRDGSSEYVVKPASQTRAQDTTGAGDAFTTGFLYGLIKGEGLKECGQLGDIAAQLSISKTGARAGLPTADELARRYGELYNQQL